jgi:hypothetical protein
MSSDDCISYFLLVLFLLLFNILDYLPHTLRTLFDLLLLTLTQLYRNLSDYTLSTQHHGHGNTHIHVILKVTDGSYAALVIQDGTTD